MRLGAQSRLPASGAAPSVHAAGASSVQQNDFDRGEEHTLGRLFLPAQPASEVDVRDLELPGQLPDSAEDQAGAVQRAGIDARMFRRRQGAIPGGGGKVSHKRYGATLSGHTQVAINEDVLSFFGHRRVALTRAAWTRATRASGPTLRYGMTYTLRVQRLQPGVRWLIGSRTSCHVPLRRTLFSWRQDCWAVRAGCATCWGRLRRTSPPGWRARRSRRRASSSSAWK